MFEFWFHFCIQASGASTMDLLQPVPARRAWHFDSWIFTITIYVNDLVSQYFSLDNE
jgi:hypothetical protein